MKTARIWAILFVLSLAWLGAPQRGNAQSTAIVYGWTEAWYDSENALYHGHGHTSMEDFNGYWNYYAPYVYLEIDGPTGSAWDYYEDYWGAPYADAYASLDAQDAGLYTATSDHGVDIACTDIYLMSQTFWASFFHSGLMESPGFYPEAPEVPGPFEEFETYNQFVVRRPYAVAVVRTTAEGAIAGQPNCAPGQAG